MNCVLILIKLVKDGGGVGILKTTLSQVWSKLEDHTASVKKGLSPETRPTRNSLLITILHADTKRYSFTTLTSNRETFAFSFTTEFVERNQ